MSLRTWFEHQDLVKRYSRGEVYIASHVWTSEEHKVETFGRSVVGDEAQTKLSEFLKRSPGNWSDAPDTRKARWSESALTGRQGSFLVEIVGHVETMGIEGRRSPYIKTLLKHLKWVNVKDMS